MPHHDFDLCDNDRCPEKEQCERYTIYKQGGWQHRYVMHGCIDRTLIRRRDDE